jgi:hypothetical protein
VAASDTITVSKSGAGINVGGDHIMRPIGQLAASNHGGQGEREA